MTNYFIPRNDPGKNNLFVLFGQQLPNFKTKYGISDAEETKYQNALLTWIFIYSFLLSIKPYKKNITAIKELSLKGTDGGGNPGIPTLTPPTPPATQVYGILPIIQSMATRIKAHPSYTNADGIALGIVGTETGTPDDPATWKPHLGNVLSGDLVEVLWGFEGHPADGCEIAVDRVGDNVFNTIVIDPDPNFIDPTSTTGLPPLTVWRYKAIYRKNGMQVGQWSDVWAVAVN